MNFTRFLNQGHQNRWIYETASAEVNVQSGDTKPKVEASNLELGITKNEDTWKSIADQYSPEIFQAELAAKYPNADEKLINEAKGRYETAFNREETEFFHTNDEIEDRKEEALFDIKKATKNELSMLKLMVEAKKDASEESKKVEESWTELRNYLGQGREFRAGFEKIELKNHFRKFVEALNDYYLSPIESTDQNKNNRRIRIPIFYPDLEPKAMQNAQKKQYDDLRSELKDNAMAKLEETLDRAESTSNDISLLISDITNTYETLSGMDNKPGLIDPEDIATMEGYSNFGFNPLLFLATNSPEAQERATESIRLMKREKWDESCDKAVDTLLETAERNGMQSQVIDAANQLLGQKDKVDSYREAQRAIKDLVEDTSELGATETLTIIRHLAYYINGKAQESIDKAPDPIQGMVALERAHLLEGPVRPETQQDKMVVDFMRGSENQKIDMLNQYGNQLFVAIKNIQTHYQKIFDDRYSKMFNREVKKVSTCNGIDPMAPTSYDKAARLWALIGIANEADMVARNLVKKEGLKVNPDQIKADNEVTQPGLNFISPKTHNVHYRSALDRGGLDLKGIALLGVKTLGALTMLTNLINTYNKAEGDNKFDKVLNTLLDAPLNPMVVGGAAVAVGAQKAERYDALLRYPWLSDYGKEGLFAQMSLDHLKESNGGENKEVFERFIHNPAEWVAMSSMDIEVMKGMTEEATKKVTKNYPMVTKEDMEKGIKDRKITSGLSDDVQTDHMRYLFYQKFFSGKEKRNVERLKEIAQKLNP